MLLTAGPLDNGIGGSIYTDALGDIRFGLGFSYKLSLPSGPYLLNFTFRDPTVFTSGGRLFTVRANGSVILDKLDIVAKGKGQTINQGALMYINDSLELSFSALTRTAVFSSVQIEPFALTQYIVPQDPQVITETNKVPTYFPNQGFYVPRPSQVTDPTGTLYQNVVVYENGIRQNNYTITRYLEQLVLDGHWTGDVRVDYQVVLPRQAPGIEFDILTTILPIGHVNVPYSAQLSASGGISPYSWEIFNGNVPGLTIGPDGVLSGVPLESGNIALSFQCFDVFGRAAQATLQVPILP